MGLDVHLIAEPLPEEEDGFFMNSTYLRSSYNGAGFDRVVPQLTGDETLTFQDIFFEALDNCFSPMTKPEVYEIDNDDGDDGRTFWRKENIPHLEMASDRAWDAFYKIKAADRFAQETLLLAHDNDSYERLDEDRATVTYLKEKNENKTGEPRYRKGYNHFYHDGLTIVSILQTMWASRPTITIVYQVSEEWVIGYMEAAKAAAKFAQRAIDIIKKEGEVEFVWSA